MSKAIRSYPRSQQAMVIKRRRTQAAGGMGYHAAISLKADMIVNGQKITNTDFPYSTLSKLPLTNATLGYPNLSTIPLSDTQETDNA